MTERNRIDEREVADRKRAISPRVAGNPKQGHPAYTLIIPAYIVRDVEERGAEVTDFSFAPELTEDGILFRIVKRSTPVKGWT